MKDKAGCLKEGMMKVALSIFLWLFPTIFLSLGVSLLRAQVGPAEGAVSVAGKITSVKGQELIVAAPNGDVQVKTADKTIIRGEVPIKFSEITPGMYVEVTAAKAADGTFRATRLHIFSEDQRGTGEGHKPLSSAPQSGLTMTNANVETVEDVAVQDVKGRMLTLKYKDGEIKVLVPPDIPVVKRVLGDAGWLKPGAEVLIQGTQADGSLSASQITVRASGTR
ncbi:MAG TPA: DUF5666 domain-containing protein [Candidatus Binatia bacterium]|jgi:hypothetical protein|nr:DUF5666 domain-containing protein [Candidatus Binatia bacterium]